MALALPAALATVVTAFPASLRAETRDYQPMLLVGAGGGLSDDLGGVLETHLGLGARLRKLRLVGVVDYTYSSVQPFLATWAIVRHQAALSSLAIYSPIDDRGFHVHGSVGAGRAWDSVDMGATTLSAERLIWTASAGIGWNVLTVLVRGTVPPARVEQPLQDAGGTSVVLGTDGLWQVLVTGSFVLDFDTDT